MNDKLKVCEKCPATQWGKKSICSVYNLHVGKIETCPEWDNYIIENQGLLDRNGQLAYINLEPALEVMQKVEEEIKDYHWMVKEVERLRKEIDKAISSNPSYKRNWSLPMAMLQVCRAGKAYASPP
ncbi:hypothetical protein [Brevibacillus formosus]|uniref:hypothetical protein n=1 Tax=Brevibacillus formosus TaxID=54913 RepID=UPI002155D5D6|nr:hypothetical protein [Brevibacillus formosus]